MRKNVFSQRKTLKTGQDRKSDILMYNYLLKEEEYQSIDAIGVYTVLFLTQNVKEQIDVCVFKVQKRCPCYSSVQWRLCR